MYFLNESKEKLEAITQDIQNHTFSEINSAIEDTIDNIAGAQKEIDAQYAAWMEVRESINSDSELFEELQARLDVVQRMQNEELLSLKEFVDSANQPSVTTLIGNYALTFLGGVMSSIAASLLWSWWKEYRREKLLSKDIRLNDLTD